MKKILPLLLITLLLPSVTHAAISLISGGVVNTQSANGSDVTLTFLVSVQEGDVDDGAASSTPDTL